MRIVAWDSAAPLSPRCGKASPVARVPAVEAPGGGKLGAAPPSSCTVIVPAHVAEEACSAAGHIPLLVRVRVISAAGAGACSVQARRSAEKP